MKLSELLPLLYDEQIIEVKSNIRTLRFKKSDKRTEMLEMNMEIERIRILGDEYTFVIHVHLIDSPFEKELQELINSYSLENESDTPDFILANYLKTCLTNWNKAIKERDSWYSFVPREVGVILKRDEILYTKGSEEDE